MNTQAFLEVLPLAAEGMLGVFATIVILIVGVAGLNRISRKKYSFCPASAGKFFLLFRRIYDKIMQE